jgi:hypothetical protein
MMQLSTRSKRASSSSQGGTSSRTASSASVPQIARQPIPNNNQDEEAEEELFSRGPSRLPQTPTREGDKAILTPQGDMYVHLENELICTGIMANVIMLLLRFFFDMYTDTGLKTT